MRYLVNETADIKWIQYETLNDTMNNIRNHPNRTQAVSMMFLLCVMVGVDFSIFADADFSHMQC